MGDGGFALSVFLTDSIKIKCLWSFEFEDYKTEEYENFITPDGLRIAATLLAEAPSPYLAIGNDTTSTLTLGETFRKPISLISKDVATVRFRTQLGVSEANGTHRKFSLMLYASAVPGGGEIMFNQLQQVVTKASNQVMTVEIRILFTEGS